MACGWAAGQAGWAGWRDGSRARGSVVVGRRVVAWVAVRPLGFGGRRAGRGPWWRWWRV